MLSTSISAGLKLTKKQLNRRTMTRFCLNNNNLMARNTQEFLCGNVILISNNARLMAVLIRCYQAIPESTQRKV
jgi:hypothetical protein